MGFFFIDTSPPGIGHKLKVEKMKKILIASTALLASATVASADIAISGDGRMGITNTEAAGSPDNETQFNSRFRVSFTGSASTDMLEIGASIRADNAAAGAAGTAGNVFISGDFGKLSFGDVGSAHEGATGDLHGVGYANVVASNEMGYAPTDNTTARWDYSVNGLSIMASIGQPQASSQNDAMAVGLNYTVGGITIGVGSADDGLVEETSASIRGSFAGVGFAAIVLDRDNDPAESGEHGFSLSYAVDSNLTVSAFTRTEDRGGNANDLDYTGVGFSYDLGGAKLAGGFIDGGANGRGLDYMDLGLTFSF